MSDSKIWTEKFRPKTFEDVMGQEKIVARISSFVKQKNIPHLLFSGPAGTGKSTIALVIAKELFGDLWQQNFLETNASEERGIQTVREKIKDYVRTKAMGTDIPKIIFLDEADALTREAQQALRRMMEQYTSTARFILSCVTPDTKMLLYGEREVLIKDFFRQYESNQNDLHVQNISDKHEFTKKDLVIAAVKLPTSLIGKKILEINTNTGRRIKVTNDHKLLTTSGWKKAGEISKNDKLLIYPNLERTPVEDNNHVIININEFIKFLSNQEEKEGLRDIGKSYRYRGLKSLEKEKILKRIKELKNIIKQNRGLTEREFDVYTLIKQKKIVSRLDLQKELGITRMGINYLLPSIENKGYIKRILNKKVHSFIITELSPIILRNDMDIKKTLEQEFNIKISYSTIRRANIETNKGKLDRVLGELKRKKILDLNYNNIEKIGALTRICGFVLGDGHIVRDNIRIHFSGNEDALKEVQKDLDILEYESYSKIKSVVIENKIGERKIIGRSTSFFIDSSSLSSLLQYFGIPKGDKTIVSYNVPEFIKNGTKYVKREFIRALFGCDADKPKFVRMNSYALSLRQNKANFLEKNMVEYYQEISKILSEFNVNSYINVRNKGEIRKKDNVEVLTFELTIKPNNKNLFRFFSRMGYAYENYKNNLARLSAEYLRHKCYIIKLWEAKSKIILTAISEGKGITELANQYEVTPSFISNQLKGKKVHLPRKQFISFEEWTKKYKFNDLLLINTIHEIKEIKAKEVMDITCYQDHNFVTNGFVSHNCNYGSKIIDPIQSRCAIFRFKPLEKEPISNLINKIAKEEKIKVDPKAIEAIYQISEGDVRRVINIMQSCASVSKTITESLVYELSSAAEPKELKQVLELALSKNFLKAKDQLLDIMLKHGLSGLDIIKQIQKEVWNLKIEDEKKLKIIEKCGEIEFRMVEGSDEYLQLQSLLASFL